MGTLVKNLYKIGTRWKYRKAIPARLRPYIDDNLTEYVRWLGKADGSRPSPEVLKRYTEVDAECSRLIAMAEKRAAGQFDELTPEAIAHIIADARHDLLDTDDERRFDPAEDELFRALHKQLEDVGAGANHDPERRWAKRQESIEWALEAYRNEYRRGELSEFTVEEALDRCAARGLHVDTESQGFRKLARAYLELLIEVSEICLQRQEGKPVPTPEPPAPLAAHKLRATPNQTITGLVDGWWNEAKAAGRSISTFEARERAARQFSEFLEHDDANAVTPEDVVRFKDFRLAQSIKPKTIKAGDLDSLNSLFQWGVDNRRVRSNPVQGVKVRLPKKTRERPQGFTDEEAEAILSAARAYEGGQQEGRKLISAKRWVPWLLAYTGARVGEIVQLRGKDVFRDRGRWVIRITPEAGTVKAGDMRDVLMHTHLVELGFPEFANDSGDGYLFISPTKLDEEGLRGARRTAKNKIRDFVRETITDKRVQPNHGWRHRFKTTARDLGKREDVTNTIIGHSVPGVANLYGETSLKAQEKFFEDWPRFKAGPPCRRTRGAGTERRKSDAAMKLDNI